MNYAFLLSVLISFIVGGLIGQNKAEQESIAMSMTILALITMAIQHMSWYRKTSLYVVKIAESGVALASLMMLMLLSVGATYFLTIGVYGEMIGANTWGAATMIAILAAAFSGVLLTYPMYQLYRLVKVANKLSDGNFFNDLSAATVENHVKS